MEYAHLLVEIENKVACVVIDRPDKLNALNRETIASLSACFKDLEADQEVKSIVLTGSGEKAFVAGADISEFADFDIEQGEELARKGQAELFDMVAALTTPVIAAINGYALGGGLELAMSCHMRMCSDQARMGLPEVTLGLIPGYGGTQRLQALVGRGKALEMITSAQMIKAEEALQFGLVNQVVAHEALMDKSFALAEKIARNSSTAIASAIRAINAFEYGEDRGYQKEIEEFGKCFGTEDFQEGTEAFLQKRKPNFK